MTQNEDKSKTRRKHESRARQALGTRLVGLSGDQLNRMDLPEILREAVAKAQVMKSREARRRQLQYIGAVMRRVDAVPIENALDQIDRRRDAVAAVFQSLERWRNALIEGGDGVTAQAASAFPDADIRELERLVRGAREERSRTAPPRAARELFRYLRRFARQDLEPPAVPRTDDPR